MKAKHPFLKARLIVWGVLSVAIAPVLAQEQLINLPVPTNGLRYASFADLEIKWPSAHGEGSVCLWGDDKFSAVSITIDDNNAVDIPLWRQISADYGWKVTWFLIVYPGMWDIYNNVPGNNTGYNGTVAQWKELYDEGHEIGLHGACDAMNALSESNYLEHINLSIAHLESGISNNVATYAYPCGTVDSPERTGGFEAVCSNIFISARGTSGGATAPATVDYLNTKSMGTATNTGAGSNWEALEDKTTKLLRYSSYRGWAVILYHKVQDSQALLNLMGFIKTNEYKYWVKPFGHVARYAQERESSTLTVTQATSTQISFTLTDRMHDGIFNVPLTVKFRVDGWGGASAVQNGQAVPVRMIETNGVTYALVDAVPDQGSVTLSKSDSAGFTATPTSGWAPLTVSFTDTSTISGITNRFWSFGDGATTNTTATNVTHIYTAAGTSTVQLIVSSPSGTSTNTQVAAVTITIPVAPSAAFSASPTSGTAPLSVTFSDSSTGSITNRYWNFGDGITTNTTATNVTHTYASSGTSTVQLVVSGPAGASTNTQSALITVTDALPSTNTVTITSATADNYIGLNTSGTPVPGSVSSTILTIADDNAGSSRSNQCAVIMFALPVLGAGQTVTAANLALDIYAGYIGPGTDPLPKGVDIYGLRYSTNSAVRTNDYGFKTVTGTNDALIMNNIAQFTQNIIYNYTIYETDASGDAALVNWINAQYAAGAVGGNYVFLRIHSDSQSANGISIASGDTVTNTAPALTLGIGSQASNPDVDGDGIPDIWEAQYFGGSTNANPAALAANGVNTINEIYIAGLNPTNPQAAFALSGQQTGAQSILQWSAVSGRVYSVYWTTNLLNGFQPLATNIIWPQSSWTDAVHGAQNGGFYRIKVQLGL